MLRPLLAGLASNVTVVKPVKQGAIPSLRALTLPTVFALSRNECTHPSRQPCIQLQTGATLTVLT